MATFVWMHMAARDMKKLGNFQFGSIGPEKNVVFSKNPGYQYHADLAGSSQFLPPQPILGWFLLQLDLK